MAYTLTNAQEEAIFKMEAFVGIVEHREFFASREEFQEYWDLLDQRCKRRRHKQKAIQEGKIDYQKIEANKAKKVLAYYQKEDALWKYGEEYFQKYLPSPEKLYQQLLKKCQKEELSRMVADKILHHISEQDILKTHFSRLYSKGKSLVEIKTKLRKKLFSWQAIEDLIALELNEDNDARKEALKQKVIRLMQKGRSPLEIRGKLQLKDQEADWLQEFLAENYCGDDRLDGIIAEVVKCLEKTMDEKKIIQKLMRRGFSYEEVKNGIARAKQGEAF